MEFLYDRIRIPFQKKSKINVKSELQTDTTFSDVCWNILHFQLLNVGSGRSQGLEVDPQDKPKQSNAWTPATLPELAKTRNNLLDPPKPTSNTQKCVSERTNKDCNCE